jgi:hypothetical protein
MEGSGGSVLGWAPLRGFVGATLRCGPGFGLR